MPTTEVDDRKDRHSAGKPGSSINQPLKKGGGGGKFTAGRPGDEAGALDVVDPNDPNYDSESEEPTKPKEDTFFDRVVRGELEIASVFEDEQVCAVEETNNPQAATHILMFPKERLTGLKHWTETGGAHWTHDGKHCGDVPDAEDQRLPCGDRGGKEDGTAG
jgi:hypothetical protein